jgi:hypothetical protein
MKFAAMPDCTILLAIGTQELHEEDRMLQYLKLQKEVL